MEKKNLYALLALVALAGLAYYAMRTPEKGDRIGDKPRALAEIKAANITSLEISQPGGGDKVTLTKKGEKWQVTAPYDKPADQQAAKSAVEALEKIKWGDVTTQQKERYGELEVSDDKAVHVVAKDGAGATLADLYLGKTAGSATMVRVAGKDEVWQATDFYTSSFKRDGKSWREHVIYDFKADEATKVSLSGAGGKLVLERVQPAADGKDAKPSSIMEAKWKIVEGTVATLKPGVELDHMVANRIAQGVSTLRAGDFLDAAKPEEVGLAPGAAGQIEVSVTYKDGKSAGVRVGSVKGEDYHVQTLDSPQIFTVKKWSMEQVAHLPADFGDKSLVSLKADQIDSVTIVSGPNAATDVLVVRAADKGWKADKVADADDAKLKSIAEAFDGVNGNNFVAAGAAELASLVKPRATVTIARKGGPKAGAPVVLKIGEARGDDVVVQKGDAAVGEAVWVKKYQVDRFLKKPADVGKDKK